MINTIRDKHEGITVFNEETGEVYHHHSVRKKKVSNFDRYVGIDTKYPEQCITKESLIESLCVLDAYVCDDRVWMASDMLIESVTQGLMTPQQLKLVKHLIQNLCGWNIYIGTTEDLCSCGIDSRNMSRLLTELSTNTLRVINRNKPFKGDIVIQVNPFFGWRGDNEYRTMKVNRWYEIGVEI